MARTSRLWLLALLTSSLNNEAAWAAAVSATPCVDGGVRAEGGSAIVRGQAFYPEVFHGGTWHPICGHYYWDDDEGASAVCRALGFERGTRQITRRRSPGDAMPVGRCRAGEALTACTAGGNAWGRLSYRGSYCATGQRVGVQVTCRGAGAGQGSPVSSSCRGLAEDDTAEQEQQQEQEQQDEEQQSETAARSREIVIEPVPMCPDGQTPYDEAKLECLGQADRGGADPAKQPGFCVSAEGHDVNHAVERQPGSSTSDDECLRWCQAQPGRTFGCERIVNQDNHGCYLHRAPEVHHGNTAHNHVCWILDALAARAAARPAPTGFELQQTQPFEAHVKTLEQATAREGWTPAALRAAERKEQQAAKARRMERKAATALLRAVRGAGGVARLFEVADGDSDGELTVEEFVDFASAYVPGRRHDSAQ